MKRHFTFRFAHVVLVLITFSLSTLLFGLLPLAHTQSGSSDNPCQSEQDDLIAKKRAWDNALSNLSYLLSINLGSVTQTNPDVDASTELGWAISLARKAVSNAKAAFNAAFTAWENCVGPG